MRRRHYQTGAALAFAAVVAVAVFLSSRTVGSPKSGYTDVASDQERTYSLGTTEPDSVNASSPIESYSVYAMYEETGSDEGSGATTLEVFYADPDRLRVNRYSSGKSREEGGYSIYTLSADVARHATYGGRSGLFSVTVFDKEPGLESLRSPSETGIPTWIGAARAPFGEAETVRVMVENGLAAKMGPDTACGRTTVVLDVASDGQDPRRVVELDADTYLLLESKEYSSDDDIPSRSLVCLRLEYGRNFEPDTFSIEAPPGSEVTRNTVFEVNGDTVSRLSFVPLSADPGEGMELVKFEAVIDDSSGEEAVRYEFVHQVFESPDGGKQILIQQRPHGAAWPRGSFAAKFSAMNRDNLRPVTIEMVDKTAVLYELTSGVDAKTSSHGGQFLLDVGEIEVVFVSTGVGGEQAMTILRSLAPVAPSATEGSSVETD